MENGITEYFEDVETIKSYSGYFYSVAEAITIVILGSLCKCENVGQVHQWAESEQARSLLRERFGIEKVPCYYWLLTLMNMVKPESLNECFRRWVEAASGGRISGRTVAVDGKTMRSSGTMGGHGSALHVVSAYISELGMTFAQKAVEGKGNEIGAAQSLLEELEIGGCVVVADALNCQKKTAEAVISGKADYVLCVKDNQPALKKELGEYFGDERLREKACSASETEANGGRIERRTVWATEDVGWLPQKCEWKGLKSIAAIRREAEKKKGGEKSCEWSYYISSLDAGAEELLRRIRCEWSVESMHWLLDVHFREDFCRIESRNAQQNLSMLRKAALNLIKRYKANTENPKTARLALSKLMFKCLLEPKFILEVLEL